MRAHAVRRTVRLAGLALMGLTLLLALRIVAGKLLGPFVLARAEREFQRDVGSLELADWFAPAPPSDQNLGMRLLEIGRRLPPDLRKQLKIVRDVPLGGESENAIVGLQEVVARQQRLLDELRTLPELPQSGAERIGGSADTFTRSSGAYANPDELLLPAQILAADARLALHSGDRTRALADLRALRWIATILRRDPGAFPWMLARPAEQHALTVANILLQRDGAAVAAGVSAELAALEAGGSDLRRMLAGEALLGRKMTRERTLVPAAHEQDAPWADLFFPFTSAHLEAASLSSSAFVARALEIPVPRWPRDWADPSLERSQLVGLICPWAPFPVVEPTLQRLDFDGLREAQRLASARRLGRIAAALAIEPPRTDATTPPPEPFAGAYAPLPWSDEPPQIERQPDGSWTVSSPLGAELCRERQPGEPDTPATMRESRALLFRWEVPAPRVGNADPPLPVEGKTNPNLERQR
ncbi:MAG: hypothetical protein IPJ17_06055 [Holophagales bacterium]|nr:MAG: hypothetical protein IPJ17_06055 [Holophagales bacterium]